MLIVNQMRTGAFNARDLSKIRIEDVESGGIKVPAIVAYTWEPDSKLTLGTYDSESDAQEALTDLALSWEKVNSFFMG